MAGTTELEDLYSVIGESARLVGVDASRDKVWPVLTAYRDVIPQSAIAFRVETSARRGDDFSCRFTMIPKDVDPYALALANGLTPRTGHPVASLSADIAAACPIDNYGVDFGVVGGFTKTFQFFPPDDLQPVSTLADIAAVPPALAENSPFFARHGVADQVALTGMDYEHRTFNVYFKTPDGYLREPKNVAAILSDIDMPEPSDQLLTHARSAGGFYVTLNWDSPGVQRICFSAMTADPSAVTGGRIEPRIEQLARNAPSADPGAERRFIAYVASSPAGEYFKLLSFYRAQPDVVRLWREYEDN
ncbi:aromatic prenyltransferase [Streptomyces sp. NBC_01198]|uniref:aromatic prenyltransferase n=1 Tax=Streptomyces sp. NBC_01198 TaxID=2903769 RepID=UPI002E0E0A3E|nr:aromatic prenyltransferase [Streptomyces sp. NBC_01198]